MTGVKRHIILFVVVIVVFFNGCGPSYKMDILIQMIDAQERYFRNEIVPPFEKEHQALVNVIKYSSTDSLESYMEQYKNSAGVVKVPFDKSRSLMDEKYFVPLDSFLLPQELLSFRDNYLLTSLGVSKGKQFLIPRKFETRIMVFNKSKVLDAVSMWRKYTDQIDSVLQSYNNYGLPSTYMLETDPEKWDYYDIFVVGWIWAHSLYDGKLHPRIAHRGKRYSGTSLGIIDCIYQLNGDSSMVGTLSGDPVYDALHWEAVYAAAGIFNPDMWEKSWSGAGIWKAFSDGEVFLSFMTQLDCFFLHGTGQDSLNGYFKDPDDMGVATMPQGCSFELDATGVPSRMGNKSITTGGWWWAIPKGCPNPKEAFALASHITSTTMQVQECSRFGMIPVRKEILSDMMMLFGGGWISEIYDVSFKQLMYNGHTTIPSINGFDRLSNLYLDMWYDIVVNKNWSNQTTYPSRSFIRDRIETVYIPKAAEILNSKQIR
jgi:ABC-type glycerol-3-phosphate transport system substrate-binding protein